MTLLKQQLEALLAQASSLHEKKVLSQNLPEDYFEPGMMEYLDCHEGVFLRENRTLLLRFEAKGTRYEGRTEQIERLTVGDSLKILRDANNAYNPNNFTIVTEKGENVGNMPAQLCNAVAPLYDGGQLALEGACVSFVEPISRRSRYAKQAILFVEMKLRLTPELVAETL